MNGAPTARTSKVKSNRIRKQLLIPQEKVPTIINFKPPTFIISPPKDIVSPKNNHSTSYPSNPGSSYFLSKKNLFSLSKITPFGLEKGKITSLDLQKGNFFTFPPSSFFLSIPTVSTSKVVVIAATIIGDDAACDAPKPGGPLTTRQPEEFLWISSNPVPYYCVPFIGIHIFTKIGYSRLCSGSSTQYTTCITVYPRPIQGLNRSS